MGDRLGRLLAGGRHLAVPRGQTCLDLVLGPPKLRFVYDLPGSLRAARLRGHVPPRLDAQEHDSYRIFGPIEDVLRLYGERLHQTKSDLDEYYADSGCFEQGMRKRVGRMEETYSAA